MQRTTEVEDERAWRGRNFIAAFSYASWKNCEEVSARQVRRLCHTAAKAISQCMYAVEMVSLDLLAYAYGDRRLYAAGFYTANKPRTRHRGVW